MISHYLETAGVGGSILDDPCAALRRAIDEAPDETQAVAAVLRELRAAAQLTWTQPEQFDDVFRRAAAVGEFLTEGLMAGLLERRGTPEATVGTLDVVRALVDRMPDGIGLPHPSLYYALEDFVRSVTTGAPVACSAEEGARAASSASWPTRP